MSQQPQPVGEVAGQVAKISPKLAERLDQFQNGYPERHQVSQTTRSTVKELLCWLCDQSGTVSATVSQDGVLNLAAVFLDDVHLYIEVDRDGSTEAAVTRQRRYARDIAAGTIADVTPEAVLAAVASI